MEHDIQDSSLERFAAGKAIGEEARAIARHLLHACPYCAGRLRSILRPSVTAADYGPALDTFTRTCLGQPREPEAARSPSEPPPSPASRKRLRPPALAVR